MRGVTALLVTLASIAGGLAVIDEIGPATSEIAGDVAIGNVVSAARTNHLMTGEPWADSLANVGLVDGDITVAEFTVRHVTGLGCWEATVLDAWATVVVVPCEVTP